jgi:hypothetical protein
MSEMGGDVFGGSFDPNPFSPSFGERSNNGDAERNRLYQERLNQQSQHTNPEEKTA